ncbi:MAG: zf-HC2 domain-containing protein [Vicinamibacterales bacterium]
MTTDTVCTFGDRREDVLIAYLYDDIDTRDRVAFERHLASCAVCRLEVNDLTDVRGSLAEWADPVVAEGIGGQAPRAALRLVERPAAPRGWRVLADAPIWMQAAAAMLVIAASLGLANINLTYSRDGLSVTTGWMRPAPVTAAAPQTQTVSAQPAPATDAPWRAELTALEQQLRSELATRPAPVATAAASSTDDEALLKRVRVLLQESERRQQSELALRVAEMARDNQTQRQADLVRIDRTLGLLQSRTGVEVMRTQQQLNNLAQRVSQRE